MTLALAYAGADEAKAARKLVNLILGRGWVVSVNDGDEWVLQLSGDRQAILKALCSTGQDQLVLRDEAGFKVGWMQLVWGNSGEELVCDHSDNDALSALWNEWQAQL